MNANEFFAMAIIIVLSVLMSILTYHGVHELAGPCFIN